MPSWYQGKIRYQQQDQTGKTKTINETYLIDAVTYTDAEARLYKEVAANTPDFTVTNISRMKLADLFHFDEGGETWYKCKVVYVTEDEKGREKRIVNMMLVNAENVKQAYDRIAESLKTMLIPFDTTDINATKILDIFPYTEEDALPPNLRPLHEAVTEE